MTDVAALIRRLRDYGDQLDASVAIARHTVIHHGAELQREAATALERYQRVLTAAQAWRDAPTHFEDERALALLAAIEECER
jgi:hypothetical protein